MRTRACTFASLLLLASCGYRPLNAPGGGSGFHVSLGNNAVPDAVVANEVLFGVRDGLMKRGALLPGAGYPNVEVDVLRADSVAEGISLPAGAALPSARATDIGVTGRARVVTGPGVLAVEDTGDVRAFEVSGIDTDPLTEGRHDLEAARSAARQLGERLAAMVLGEPAGADAPLVR